MRSILVVCGSVLLAGAPSFAQSDSGPEPAVAFSASLENELLTIRGVTPGGQIGFVAVERDKQHYAVAVRALEGVERDEDQNGEIEVRLDHHPPDSSAWAVVDLASSSVAFTNPDSYPLRLEERELKEILPTSSPEADFPRIPGAFVEVLIARGAGTLWRVSAVDGGEGDADLVDDHAITLDLQTARALIAGGPELTGLSPGDLVIAIDPKALVFWIYR